MKIGLKKKIINGRIANELYLKRLIVGGFDGVYEFSKNFKVDAFKVFSKWDFEDRSTNNFFEVKIKGGWFIDPIELIEGENYKTK